MYCVNKKYVLMMKVVVPLRIVSSSVRHRYVPVDQHEQCCCMSPALTHPHPSANPLTEPAVPRRSVTDLGRA